jgi:hypothetical protein
MLVFVGAPTHTCGKHCCVANLERPHPHIEFCITNTVRACFVYCSLDNDSLVKKSRGLDSDVFTLEL